MTSKTCPTCGKEFGHDRRPSYTASRTYCSRVCFDKAKPHICKLCHKTFYGGEKNAVYCSVECHDNAGRETLICPCCGKVFTVRKSAKRKYCSNACADKMNTVARTKRETRQCLICGKSFENKPSKNQRYCSSKCAGIGEAARKNSPHWQTHKCDWCGTTFTRWRIEPIHFCSRACQGHWMSEHRKGENHPSYKTGRILSNRGSRWQHRREVVKKRDGYKCQICGRKPKRGEKRVLSVHHIRPYRNFVTAEEANVLPNLITLCRKCHDKVEHGKLPCPRPLL